MYEKVCELVRQQPFKPFQVRLTNGKAIPIRDPENVMMSWGRVFVCFPKDDRFYFFDEPEIVAIDFLKRGQRKK